MEISEQKQPFAQWTPDFSFNLGSTTKKKSEAKSRGRHRISIKKKGKPVRGQPNRTKRKGHIQRRWGGKASKKKPSTPMEILVREILNVDRDKLFNADSFRFFEALSELESGVEWLNEERKRQQHLHQLFLRAHRVVDDTRFTPEEQQELMAHLEARIGLLCEDYHIERSELLGPDASTCFHPCDGTMVILGAMETNEEIPSAVDLILSNICLGGNEEQDGNGNSMGIELPVVPKSKNLNAVKPHPQSSSLARFDRSYEKATTDLMCSMVRNPQKKSELLAVMEARCEASRIPIAGASLSASDPTDRCIIMQDLSEHLEEDEAACWCSIYKVGDDIEDLEVDLPYQELGSAVLFEGNSLWTNGDSVIKQHNLDDMSVVRTLSLGQRAYSLGVAQWGGRSRLLAGVCSGDVHIFDITDSSSEDGEMSDQAGPEIISVEKHFRNSQGIGPIHQMTKVLSSECLLGFEGNCSFWRYDFETDKVISRYLGHTASITKISMDPEQPSVLASASRDHTVKIWDLRTSKPMYTLYEQGESMQYAVCLANIGGYPLCFAGGANEAITAWDLRNNRCLYELSTGNNIVRHLNWFPRTSTLFAATTRPFHRRIREYPEDSDESYDSEETEYESEDEDSEGWPRHARHCITDFEEEWNANTAMSIFYNFGSSVKIKVSPTAFQASPLDTGF